MGLSKSDKFSTEQNQLSNVFKALGHPARLAILKILIARNACVCGDIVDELPLSQSTISQHISELKKIGLIKGTISGPSVCYCINLDVWKKMKVNINELINLIDSAQMIC